MRHSLTTPPLTTPSPDASDASRLDANASAARPVVVPGGGLGSVAAALRDRRAGRQLALLFLFTALHNFKPSEPFLVEHYASRGVPPRRAFRDVFPVFTYARLPALALVALGARRAGCKTVVFVGAVCACVTVAITLLPRLAPASLAASQVAVACSFASHQAFTALAFATLPRSRFPAFAHGAKAVAMASNCASALLGQIARTKSAVSVEALFYVSLATQAASLAPALAFRGETFREASETTASEPRAFAAAPSRHRDEDETDPAPALPNEDDGRPPPVSRSSRFLWRLSPRLSRPARWWCAWSVACAPSHAFVASNWQTLAAVARGARASNGYFLAAQYFAAGVASLLVGGAAYARAGGEASSRRALIGSAGGMAALVFAVAALERANEASGGAEYEPWMTYLSLASFACAFEATSCVCAAAIAAGAMRGGEGARAGEEPRGGGRTSRGEDAAPAEGRAWDGDGDPYDGEDEDGDEEETSGDGRFVDLGEEEASQALLRPLAPGRGDVDASSGPFVGGRLATLFVALSAFGYLIETAFQTALDADGGTASLGARFGVHAAALALAAVGLFVASSRRCGARGRGYPAATTGSREQAARAGDDAA